MPHVSEPDLYLSILGGYRVFDERMPADRQRDMNAIIDEMNARDFGPNAYGALPSDTVTGRTAAVCRRPSETSSSSMPH